MKIITDLKELMQLNKLTDTEIQVVDYLLQFPHDIEKISSRQLAELTHTSPATVVRVCQKLGFSGYAEFKIKYLQDINQTPAFNQIEKSNPITSSDNIHSIINKVASLEMSAIEETKKGLDIDQLQRVANLLNQATHLDIYAFDNNLHLAKHAASHFLYAGKSTVVHDGSNAQFMQVIASTGGHVAMIISRTGENVKLHRMAKVIRDKNIPLIVLTESKNSSLAQLSTEHLYVYNVHRFTDMGTILFQTSAQYVFDVLFAILFSKNYDRIVKQNQFYENLNEYHELLHFPYKL